MNDFIQKDGVLSPLLDRLKKDHTLMLAIRENYVNIYYRGGNILKIMEEKKGYYSTFFDTNYIKSPDVHLDTPQKIISREDCLKWVDSLPLQKLVMDEYFSCAGKSEREFQQLIARENNYSSISKNTEYFISDIEVSETFGRFDLIGFKWLVSQRKKGSKCKVALFEMKYGDGSIEGKSGILKHLQDLEKLVADKVKYFRVVEMIESQFDQLDQLGLLKFNKGTSEARVTLDPHEPPEVIFILANHNPRSSKLTPILNHADIERYAHSDLIDLKFFTACFSGYGLHSNCMKSLDVFRNLYNSF